MLFLIVLCLLPLFFSGNLSPIYVTNSTNLIDESNCRVNGKSLLPCATLDELPMYMLPQYADIHIYFIHESYTINKNGNIILRVLTASLTLQPLKCGKYCQYHVHWGLVNHCNLYFEFWNKINTIY